MKWAMPPLLRICFDSYGSEATKDKQLSFAYASHVCDCQSYRTNTKFLRGFYFSFTSACISLTVSRRQSSELFSIICVISFLAK